MVNVYHNMINIVCPISHLHGANFAKSRSITFCFWQQCLASGDGVTKAVTVQTIHSVLEISVTSWYCEGSLFIEKVQSSGSY